MGSKFTKSGTAEIPVSRESALRLAAEACVDVRTAEKYLSGEDPRGLAKVRCDRAAPALGLNRHTGSPPPRAE
jgi:hypothetical protein